MSMVFSPTPSQNCLRPPPVPPEPTTGVLNSGKAAPNSSATIEAKRQNGGGAGDLDGVARLAKAAVVPRARTATLVRRTVFIDGVPFIEIIRGRAFRAARWRPV
jgi:hypothetical protein